jgi:3-hydroxyacyl-CoA dehydrogenase
MRAIENVAVIGGNGTMGSLSGGLFAQAGIHCIFFAPSVRDAQGGIENAVRQARSDAIREYIRPESFDALEPLLPKCNWVLEAVSEDLALKQSFNRRVDLSRKRGSIVSSMSSGLSIEDLAAGCSDDFRAHFMGVHFFNPPGSLLACELTAHPDNDEGVKALVYDFCERVLRRVNIVTNNCPAFAGNRIGFQFLNEAALYAEEHGVETVDYLLGPFTGRAIPPLATIDHVGLDVHRAIVDNIYRNSNDERHESFRIPGYVQRMIDGGMLGRKSGSDGGFYRYNEKKHRLAIDPSTLEHGKLKGCSIEVVERIKRHIHDGEYRSAVSLIQTDDSEPMRIVRRFIAGYIAYSYSRIGEVTPEEHGIHGIDRVMAHGFSWFPPSAWVDVLGGPGETARFLEQSGYTPPGQLSGHGRQCRIPEVYRYLIAY